MLKKTISVILVICLLLGTNLITHATFNAASSNSIPTDALEFNDHYYAFFDEGLAWDDAESYCENIGGHLVTITSQDEQSAVETLLSSGTKNCYWMGGERINTQWQWVTNEDFSYTLWASGQPDNANGVENKLMIFKINYQKWGYKFGYWNDMGNECVNGGDYYINRDIFGKNHFGFICEWDNSQSNELDFSKDVWHFKNFSEKRCYLYKNPYLEKLTPSNRAIIEEKLKSGSKGHCFGMSATVILQKLGLEDLTKYDNVDCLRKVRGMREAKTLICYYQAMQRLRDFQQEAQTFMNHTTAEQLGILSRRADDVKNGGNPVLLCFGQSGWGAHAVVAYALEPGTFVSSATGSQYDHRILLYDCNNIEWSENCCLLFNEGTDEWEIPYYVEDNVLPENGAYLICAAMETSSFDAIDDIRQTDTFSNPVAGLSSSEKIVMTCKETGEQWIIDTKAGEITGSSDLLRYSDICINDSENNNKALNIVLPYSNAEYAFEAESNTAVDFDLNVLYTDRYLSVECDSANGANVSSDGTVSINGNAGDYVVVSANDMMQTEGKFDTFTISGSNEGDTIISLSENNICVNGDSIEGIVVEASNENYVGKTTIEGINSIELDNDMDNYETVKKTEAKELILGDADGDDTISIIDATIIQRYLAGYTVSNTFAVEFCGDIVGDGIDILDATLIQRYLASFAVNYPIGESI